jgi:zinc and cadmium transporter
MTPFVTIIVYCLLTIAASLAGGWLPSLVKLNHLKRQLMMSLVSGVMLGVALLHMLPASLEHLKSASLAGGAMLAGLLVMFFLLRVFHVHSHAATDGHDCEHDHHHEPVGADESKSDAHQFSWIGLFVGLAIHSLLDGVAISASVTAEIGHGTTGAIFLGLGTFLVVFLHKPLDALAITSLMHAASWSSRMRTMINMVFSLICPLGAVLFWFGAEQFAGEQETLVGIALAFSAGFFLCIALSDLLPEVAFHSHDRGKLTAALIIGLLLAVSIESMHSHDHPVHDQPHDQQHDSHDHDAQEDHAGHDHAEHDH